MSLLHTCFSHRMSCYNSELVSFCTWLRSTQRLHESQIYYCALLCCTGCQSDHLLVQGDGASDLWGCCDAREEAHRWSQLECHGCAGVVPGRLGTAAEWLGTGRRRGTTCCRSPALSGADALSEGELCKDCSPSSAYQGGWLGTMGFWACGWGLDGLLFCSSPVPPLLQCAEALWKTGCQPCLGALAGLLASSPATSFWGYFGEESPLWFLWLSSWEVWCLPNRDPQGYLELYGPELVRASQDLP